MKSKLTPLFFLIVLLVGCLDPIEFERPETIQDGLAIQGKLTKGEPSHIRVTVRKVFNFKERESLLNVKSVDLIDEKGNQFSIPSFRDGVFDYTLTDFPIDYHVGYKIRVSTFDNRTFESSLESVLPVPTPKNLTTRFIEKKRPNVIGDLETVELLSFGIDTPIKATTSDTNSRILWELQGTYKLTDDNFKTCYVDISPFQNYIPFNGTTSSASEVEAVSLYETIPNLSIFAQGYYFSVFQQSLSETAFDYWSQLNFINNRSGNMFEPPVGNITSNLVNIDNPKEEVFGFFYATEERVLRTYVSPQSVGYPSRSCPCVCPLTASSTKPSWWIE